MEQEDNSDEENEQYEPQITSSNPAERKLARQLRIQRRVEALKKDKIQDEGEAAAAESDETNPIQAQIEKSADFLRKLIIEGDEYVSNVRIANEAREADRREREGFGRAKVLQELEDEAAGAEEMFNDIAAKWSNILRYNDPLHINDDILSQKEKCDELIRQKDSIIALLKDKLRTAEINFSSDQRKQMEDINALTRRIENQITIMRKAYRRELELMEEVLAFERQALIDLNNKKWEDLAKRRDQDEESNSEKKEADLETFYEEMKELRLDFQEKFRETKIQMEDDCNALQREFEKIKALSLMNNEKLDYNYQILKKREDENIIIRSQQKRRINRLQDVINSLRKKIEEYSQQTSTHISKLNADIALLHRNILDIENKADYFAKANDNKFKQIWKMNQERVNELFYNIQQIDRILHEQLLGISWTPIQHKRLSSTEVSGYKSALQVLAELNVEKRASDDDLDSKKTTSNGFKSEEFLADEIRAYKRVLKLIMQQISAKTDFLMEDQLKIILEPFTKKEKTLIRVDNVFAALDIKRKEDIDLLLAYFLRYTYCPVCSERAEEQASEKEIKVHELGSRTASQRDSGSSFLKHDIDNSSQTSELNQQQKDSLNVALYLNTDLEGECLGPINLDDMPGSVSWTPKDILEEKVSCQFHHPLVISNVYVLTALREFLGMYHVAKSSLPTMRDRIEFQRSTVSRLVTESDIEMYWRTFSEVFSQERERLWDSLYDGLKKYHELLKARKTVSEDVVALRRQNMELRRLFTNYIEKDM